MKNKKFLRQITNFFAKKNLTRSVLNFFDIDTVFLNYHRVISDEEYSVKQRPNNDLIVTKSTFDKQIRYLKENFNVISINQIDKDVQQKRKVVITFDDGYFDNLENAYPVLKKYECPAIIYIVTSFLNNENYPWWLKIWKIIEENEHLIYNQKKIDISDQNLKLKTYDFFRKKFFILKQSEQNFLFKEILKNLNQSSLNKKKQFLSSDDLLKLAEDNLFEIGCHTHTHQNLKLLDDDELNNEISKSKLI